MILGGKKKMRNLNKCWMNVRLKQHYVIFLPQNYSFKVICMIH